MSSLLSVNIFPTTCLAGHKSSAVTHTVFLKQWIGSSWWSGTSGTMIKASGCAKWHPGWSYSLIMHYGVDKQQSLFKPNNSKHTIRHHLDFAELGKLFNAHVPALLDRQTLEREKVEGWRWWWWWDITQVTSWLTPMVITQYSHYTVSLGIHFNWMILQYMIYPCQCSKTLSLNVIQGFAEFSNAT